MSLAAGARVYAHDDSPEIYYHGSWSQLPNIPYGELGNTAHVTSEAGAAAILTFKG
jgi:hypothetical protein